MEESGGEVHAEQRGEAERKRTVDGPQEAVQMGVDRSNGGQSNAREDDEADSAGCQVARACAPSHETGVGSFQ